MLSLHPQPVQSLVLQDIVEITITKDPELGLGMSMSAIYEEADSDMRLVVNELLYHEDGSPGPALQAGVQVGDEICSLEGKEVSSFETFKRGVIGLDTVTMEFARGTPDSAKLKDDREVYPEIVLLHIRRHTAAVPLGAKLSEVYGNGHTDLISSKEASFVVVKDVWNGPFFKGGLAVDDVILNVQNHFIENLKAMRQLIEGAREFDLIVKRMSVSDGGKGHRENKTYKCEVDIDGQLGMGLNLKEIQSGLGNTVSKTFIYVKELKEYPDGSAGPALVAGVRQHDLILKINNEPVHRIHDVRDVIRGHQTASLVIRRMVREYSSNHPHHPVHHRGANEVTVLIELNADEPMGLSISEAYGAAASEPFLVVQNVRRGSAADLAGVQYHDIIWQAAGEAVCHLDQMKSYIDGLSEFELVLRRHDFENSIGLGESNFDSSNAKII